MELNDREETAYHEAGHAVMDWALDIGINEVSTITDEERGILGYAKVGSEKAAIY